YSVDCIEGAHERKRSGVRSGMERRQINLAQSALGNFGGVVVAATFSRAVANVMLGAGGHRKWIVEFGTLIATDVSGSDVRSEIGIFACALGDSSPTRVTRDIDHGREGPADAISCSFLGRESGGLLDQSSVPSRRHPQRNWKRRAEAVDDVLTEEQRDVESRFFNRNTLHGVGLLRAADVEQRANLTVGNHFFVVAAAGSGAGWASG